MNALRFSLPRLRLLLVAVLGVSQLGCEQESSHTIQPISTSTNLGSAALFLRISGDEQDLLLLLLGSDAANQRLKKSDLDKIAGKRNILAYLPDRKTIASVSGSKWIEGREGFIDCSEYWTSVYNAPIRFDAGNKVLLFNDTKIETAGRSVLRASYSADKRFVAALSAEGEYDSGWFTGGQRASGKRYHQVFRVEDGKQVGETLIPAGAPTKDEMEQCWAPDSRWVLYYDGKFERAWIAPGAVSKK